jgi:hypothetical protein
MLSYYIVGGRESDIQRRENPLESRMLPCPSHLLSSKPKNMKWNKKSASLLAVLSLLVGGAGAVGLQVRAQQSASNQPAQIQTQTPATVEQQQNSAADNSVQDEKDNRQPESGVEQENGKETNDATEKDENLPGGGHADQAGANVDHQFEGVE